MENQTHITEKHPNRIILEATMVQDILAMTDPEFTALDNLLTSLKEHRRQIAMLNVDMSVIAVNEIAFIADKGKQLSDILEAAQGSMLDGSQIVGHASHVAAAGQYLCERVIKNVDYDRHHKFLKAPAQA